MYAWSVTQKIMVLWAVLCLFALAGCAAGASTSAARDADDASDDDLGPNPGGDDDAASDDDATDDDASDDDASDDDTDANEYNVTEKADLGALWDCQGIDQQCTDDYLHFIDLAQKYAHPISQQDLDAAIQADLNGEIQVLEGPYPEGQLRASVAGILNINFLINGIDQRALTVTTIAKTETDTYYERDLIFDDPYVGDFKAILLLPKGDGPFPAVVGVHGHASNAEDYRDNFHGNEYPAHGLAIIMPTLRAMGTGDPEDLVTRSLLLNGFTFQEIRVYETMLCLKYLKYLSIIDGKRLGLIGHSGGSIASNSTYLLDEDVKAYVTDCSSVYVDIDPEGRYLDGTVPELYPYHDLIRYFEDPTRPVITADYGYYNPFTGESDMPWIFDFFHEYLNP